MKILIMVVFLSMVGVNAVFADWSDGRVDPHGGDRIAVYCRATGLDVWGIDPNGNGFQLAAFSYPELVVAGLGGTTRALGSNGNVTAGADISGNFRVAWAGGIYNATGGGDFGKIFRCNLPVLNAPAVVYSAPVYAPAPPVYTQTVYLPPVYPMSQMYFAPPLFAQPMYYGQQPYFAPYYGMPAYPYGAGYGYGGGYGNVYIVQPGDTLFLISVRYGVNMYALAAVNGIYDINRIYAGQPLYFPY